MKGQTDMSVARADEGGAESERRAGGGLVSQIAGAIRVWTEAATLAQILWRTAAMIAAAASVLAGAYVGWQELQPLSSELREMRPRVQSLEAWRTRHDSSERQIERRMDRLEAHMIRTDSSMRAGFSRVEQMFQTQLDILYLECQSAQGAGRRSDSICRRVDP